MMMMMVIAEQPLFEPILLSFSRSLSFTTQHLPQTTIQSTNTSLLTPA
jgi:hypothetical protein